MQAVVLSFFTLGVIVSAGGELLVEPGIQCSWLVEVDEVFGSDCSGLSLEEQHNYTCNSLQDALSLVSSSFFPESCVEVIINQGRYIVEGTVIITRDLVIHGRDGHVVIVELLIQPSSDFQYSLSFRNTNSAVLRNIEFLGSNGVITFDNVSRVEVGDSSFRYFSQGAVDTYNCLEVAVWNCTFENNGPVVITKLFPVRGHSGGLSVGFFFHQPVNRTELTVVIRDSIFRNNTVHASVSGRQSTSQLLTQFLITGRGGGCSVTVFSVISVDVFVTDCLFERNYALSFGGGLYLGWLGGPSHTTRVADSSFIGNECLGGAGGLELGFGTAGSNRFFASRLLFIGNKATFGGGAYVFAGSNAIQDGTIGIFVSFQNCMFERNVASEYGGAVGLILPSFNVIFDNRDNIIPTILENCSFIMNDGGGGGVVSTSYLPLVFEGNNSFLGNRGTSLTIIGVIVKLQGHLNFVNNDVSGRDGGAVYAVSLGQLELAHGSTVLFKNNSGNLGASVVVNTIYIPQLYTQLTYDPLCVLLLEDPAQSLANVDPDDISVTFSGNKAVVGAAVYTNEIGLCSWTGALGGNRLYFNHSLAFRWDFITYSEDNRNSAHDPDDANPLYYVQTEEGQLSVATTNVTAYPGESVPFGVKVIDDLNLPTVGVFRFSDMSLEDLVDLEFSPSVISVSRVGQGIVNISILTDALAKTGVPAGVVVESLLQKEVDRKQFDVDVTSCPPGYVLLRSAIHPHLYSCQCQLDNKGVVNCDGLDIKIKDGYWASAATLQTIPCPRLYCQCHMFGGNQRCSHVLRGGDQDSQCACDREGVLCGSCKDGKGVSVLLNRCVSCSNASILLIVTLIAADSLVIVVLIMLSIQFPAWLFPCLLYVQTLPYIAETFPSTFGSSYNPLYYVTSASSLYFAYDFCLLSNLSPLLSYLFRYIPLVVALILCPVALLIGRCCRYYRGKGRKLKKWRGVWWTVNLMYSHIVHTSMSILNCQRVDTSTSSLRWYISGDVECYRDLHLPLALLAIVVLVAAFLAIPFTGIIASKPAEFTRHLSEPLLGPFKSQCRWWFAVELAKRFILILFIVVFPAINFPTLLVISVFIAATGLAWPYRDTWTTVLELVISADVMFLLLFRNTKQFVDVFSSVSLEQANSTDRCVEHSFQPSKLSYILLPFYYLPLLLSVIAFCVWIVSLIRKRMFVRDNDLIDKDIVFVGSEEVFQRSPTFSEFTLTELNLKELVQVDGDLQTTVSHVHYNRLTD